MADAGRVARILASTRRPGITALTVRGFKSLRDETRIELRPLTVLAGANSSGKSSVMQPLLLLKQTLDAVYDPGPLLLDGPNVRFSEALQMFAHLSGATHVTEMAMGIEVDGIGAVTNVYRRPGGRGLGLEATSYDVDGQRFSLHEGMDEEALTAAVIGSGGTTIANMPSGQLGLFDWELRVERIRCFLGLRYRSLESQPSLFSDMALHSLPFERPIREVIHVPGLRGNPLRTYKTTAIGDVFQGTFENYVASMIHHWIKGDDDRAKTIGEVLASLGLAWNVTASEVGDTQVEIQVGRLPHGRRGGSRDTVSIADVGFGLSQTLPVVVALLAARSQQLVYIEQPEIHLHPRAQFAMAKVLADAAKRGVRVVAETHSSLLLLGIQAAVAEGYIHPDLVKLHWFKRDDAGVTHVTGADLDENGAFGEWPEDFGMVELEAESRYLDLVEAKRALR
jgi:hypothetical protein